jgi:surface antigen
VTKLVALGSLLILTLLTSGCATSPRTPYYGEMSTASRYNSPKGIADIAFNAFKHNAYSVPHEGRYKHQNCVFFALDNLNLGEECEWATTNAMGHVQVMSHYPAGSGYCTTLLNSVLYKGQTKTWKDTACVTGTGNQWKFVSR